MAAPRNDAAIESTAPAAWREIERLVEETSTLARDASSPIEFYEGLLRRAIQALGAVGGAVWTRTAQGSLRLLCHADVAGDWLTGNGRETQAMLLGQAVQCGKSLRVPPRRNGDESAVGGNLAEAAWLLCPVVVDGETCAVIELLEGRARTAQTQGNAEQLLEALCELASEFHRRLQITELKRWKADAERIEEFSQAVHGCLDLQQVAFAIANEGRRLMGWDRVSVLIRRGRGYRVCAISGVDAVDGRANLVQSLEHFARTALVTGEPLWYGDEALDPSPELGQALHAFLDESHARGVVTLPLRAPRIGDASTSPIIGALVMERFTAEIDVGADARCAETAAKHSAAALHNALEHRNLPGFLVLDRLARVRWLTRARQLPFVLVTSLCLLALVAVLTLLPTDFFIEARGELQPEIRRDIFAPYDGVVQRVPVDHGQHVAMGELLAELRQSELDLEFTRVLGELQTARKQLDSVQATRLQPQRSTATSGQDSERLTSQEEELKKLVEGLEEQRKILVAQKAELQVLSPISGQVLSWEVRQTLEARPVQRGQRLMTIADPQGPWTLELRVPDRDIGYVFTAQAAQGPDLPVWFLLATDPATKYRGQVARIAMAPETDENHQATVLVTARVLPNQLPQPRPGASVVAKVHCGRRALGFVWFHDLIEAVQTHLLF